MDRNEQFLAQIAAERPELVEDVDALSTLYRKKLWHELSVKLEELVQTERFQRDGILLSLYQNFIASFSSHINLLKLASFAVAAAKQIQNPEEASAFLQDVIEGLENLKQHAAEQPILYLKMHRTIYAITMSKWDEASKALRAGEAELDSLDDVDPVVSAAVHRVAMSFHKARQEFGPYFRSALQYLSYVRQADFAAEERLALAVDTSLAALLGEDVYNFGELLQHPIVEALQEPGAGLEWLHELLAVFNAGDIHGYDALCVAHATRLNAQPALVAHERRLREKITLLALTEMVSELPPEERTLRLADVADRAKLPADGVELLLIKALSLRLIAARIDQVAGTVAVTWVQPRVLTPQGVARLAERLGAWAGRVDVVRAELAESAAGLVAPGAH